MISPNIKDPVLRTQVSKMLVEMERLSQEIRFVAKNPESLERRKEDRRKSERRLLTAALITDNLFPK